MKDRTAGIDMEAMVAIASRMSERAVLGGHVVQTLKPPNPKTLNSKTLNPRGPRA